MLLIKKVDNNKLNMMFSLKVMMTHLFVIHAKMGMTTKSDGNSL
jgi:hypothetical protein